MIHNWNKIKVGGKGGFDDGAYITLGGIRRKTAYILFRNKLINKIKPNAKGVAIFYDPKGYLAFKFLKERTDFDAYSLIKSSDVKSLISAKLCQKFEAKKFFKKNVKIEDDLAIIKVNLKEGETLVPGDFVIENSERGIRE